MYSSVIECGFLKNLVFQVFVGNVLNCDLLFVSNDQAEQGGELMILLRRINLEAYEEYMGGSKVKEQAASETSGKWWDHELWQEISASVTIKDVYEHLGGVFKVNERMKCLFAPDCTSKAVSLDKGFYKCFKCGQSGEPWFLLLAKIAGGRSTRYELAWPEDC